MNSSISANINFSFSPLPLISETAAKTFMPKGLIKTLCFFRNGGNKPKTATAHDEIIEVTRKFYNKCTSSSELMKTLIFSGALHGPAFR